MSKGMAVFFGAIWLFGCGGSDEALSVDPSASHAENYRDPKVKPADLHTGHALASGVRDEFLIQPKEYHAFIVEVPEGQHHYGIEISPKETVWQHRNARVAWRNVPAASDYGAEIDDLLATMDDCDVSVAFPDCNDQPYTNPSYMGEASGGSAFLIVYELLKDDDLSLIEQIIDKEAWEYSILVTELSPAPAGAEGSIQIGRTEAGRDENGGYDLNEAFIPLFDNKIPFEGDVIHVPEDTTLPFFATTSAGYRWELDLEYGLVAPGANLRVDHCYHRNQWEDKNLYDIACSVTVE